MASVYLFSECVWREVYAWVYARCREHQKGLTRVCIHVYMATFEQGGVRTLIITQLLLKCVTDCSHYTCMCACGHVRIDMRTHCTIARNHALPLLSIHDTHNSKQLQLWLEMDTYTHVIHYTFIAVHQSNAHTLPRGVCTICAL